MLYKKLFTKFLKKPETNIVPKTMDEIEAEQKALALVDAIERAGEAEKLIYDNE